MALTMEERERFLAEPHVAALSVFEHPDRAPLTVPIWYEYEPGGELMVLNAVGSRKGKAMEAAGRFTMMVQRTTPSVRYVSVEGPLTGVEPATEEQHRRMAARYLPPERVEEYLAVAAPDIGPQLAYRMRPQRWLSADLGAV